jgi:hypothetical protein
VRLVGLASLRLTLRLRGTRHDGICDLAFIDVEVFDFATQILYRAARLR